MFNKRQHQLSLPKSERFFEFVKVETLVHRCKDFKLRKLRKGSDPSTYDSFSPTNFAQSLVIVAVQVEARKEVAHDVNLSSFERRHALLFKSRVVP